MAQISGRERRLVGIGVAATLAAFAFVYVVEPVMTRHRETAELIPAREGTLQRRRQLIAQRPALEGAAADMSRELEQRSNRFLAGPTPPLAASELQRLVKDIAVSAGVQVRSERVLAPVEREGIQEIPIELTVAGGIRESVGLLYQLERTERLLTMQDLKMRAMSAGMRTPQAREILTTLTVAGYLRHAPGAPRPPERASPGAALQTRGKG
jgi:Tfp pilus assembly protein PilO